MHLRGSRNILVKLIIRSSVYWQLFIFFFFFFPSVWFVLKRRKVPSQAWGLTLLWKCLEVLLCTFLGLSQTAVLEENLFEEESCLAVMQHSGRAVSDEGGIALQEADTSCHQFLPANGCIRNIVFMSSLINGSCWREDGAFDFYAREVMHQKVARRVLLGPASSEADVHSSRSPSAGSQWVICCMVSFERSQLQHHLLCTDWDRTVHFEMEKHLVL